MNEKHNILGKISAYFIKNFRIVYLIIILIGVVGYMSYDALPREERPETTMTMMRVTVSYEGISPEEMETLVTDVIEAGVEDIDGIDSISSETSSGSSMVSITFEEDWDMDEAEVDVQSAVDGLDLPDDASDPSVGTMSTTEIPIMSIALSGDYSLIELKNYAEDIQDAVEGVDGVSEVELAGGLDSTMNIYVDEDRMEMYGLSFASITQSISAANTVNPIGSDDIDTLEYTLSITSEIDDIEDLETIIVTDIDGFPIYLSDIAEVVVEYETPSTISERYDSTLQDEKTMISAVSLSVQREADSDVIGTSAEIHEILDAAPGNIFPEDVNVIVTNEDAVNVEEALSNVQNNALSGLLLVVIVLFIFIGFKESIIVAAVIPLSLFIAFTCMSFFDITLNTMSMVALILALGMLVDNAIVIMENIDRIRDEGHDIVPASIFATNQVAPAVLAATLTTIAAFIPLAFADGMLGQIMSGIPKVVIFAIVASFIISIIVTPTLCSRLLSKHKSNKKLPIIGRILSVIFVGVLAGVAFNGSILIWFAVPLFVIAMTIKQFFSKEKTDPESKGIIIEAYGRFIDKVISNGFALAGCILITGVIFYITMTMVTTGKLQIELTPTMDSTALNISSSMPDGYLLEDAVAIGDQMEEKIMNYDVVESVVSNISQSSISYSIEIVDEDERDVSSTELLDIMREDLSTIVGASITAGQTVRGFSRSTSDIMVQIIGDDSDAVAEVSEDFMDILKDLEGTTEVTSSLTGGPPELDLIIDEEKAYEAGLDASDIATEIREHISGSTATTLIVDGDEMDVNLLYSNNDIDSVADYSLITFESVDGTDIQFDDLVTIEEIKGMDSIRHTDLLRIETVESNVGDAYNSSEVETLFVSAVANYDLPQGITIEYAGERQDIEETFSSLLYSMVAAIFLVYLILSVQFNSLSQPIVVLFTIPLATIGSIWGLILTGNNFSTYAFFGIVSLVGIAVNDAIVLIDYFNYLRKEEGLSIREAIVKGGKTRFVPVFSTTITTVGGILPLAIKDAEYAQLGYALIFGLMVATVLTLVVIPSIYVIFESSKIKVRRYVPLLADER